ncbi:PAS domain S-box protein [Bacillus sp. 31A1R]|uniref:histidine kinase n=1 Tax=Robertmurraya mangrovi TaxID=3098077 RepID=A0ABU5IWV3_9BACI|nr:PAS domain S-box protein [Bacillus sp. 31A1R]MDZ5471632.1 PAS domain S-box protein [Bacillus sp. 31A1R]
MEKQTVNILMVDDRQENLLALEAVLSSPEYRLISAKSGEEALRWVLKEEFAVILMDVQMPGLNGFDTAKIILEREKTKNIPIIFITALSQTFENVLHGYSVGAIDYILKPFDPIILKCKVEGFVSIYLNQKKVKEQKEVISKRTKELEQAYYKLKKSETIASAIGETSIDCIFTLNAEGTILSANSSVNDLFGYSKEELIGNNIHLLLPQLFSIPITEIQKRIIIESKGIRKNQTSIYVDVQLAEAQFEEEIIYVCSIRDVTDKKNQYEILEQLVKDRTNELIATNERLQKEIEEKQATLFELEESKQRYKSLFEYHPDAVFSCDLEGNYLSYNNQFLSLTGRTSEELINSPIDMLASKREYKKACFHFTETKKGKTQDYELQIINKSGDIVDIHIKNIPIIVEETVIGVYGIAKDISVEKKLWNQVYESEERYRQLVEESPEAIFVRKANSHEITFINKTGVELLRANSKEDIIGKSIFDFVPIEGNEKVSNTVKIHKNGEKIESFERKIVALDGETFVVEVTLIPFVYKGEPSIHIIMRDITELKHSREFIQQSEKLTVVGELAAGIAHEIRNPLTSLKGFTQLLDYQIGSDSDYVEIMISEIDRINTIVGELLFLSKPNQMDFKQVHLGKLLNNVIILMNAQANLHGVEIKLKTHDSIQDIMIYGLEDKLKQVFINILKNAIEAMPKGGEISLYVSLENNQVSIQVVDQGCGIPSHLLSKLGKPFYTTKEKGTGLGLMVCYSIIENHKGMMKINSVENKGTTISIELPLLTKHIQLV